MNYFLAGIYQNIKKRRPDGTPYFNLTLGLAFLLFMHLMQVNILFKTQDINLLPYLNSTNLLLLGIVTAFFFVMIRIIFPYDIISNIEVAAKDIKLYGIIFISYWSVQIVLTMILGFQLGHHMGTIK